MLIMLKFDRQKYLTVMNTQGPNAALTLLHADIELWEQETFEGQKGYQPEMWNELSEARNFSQELWEAAIKKGSKH